MTLHHPLGHRNAVAGGAPPAVARRATKRSRKSARFAWLLTTAALLPWLGTSMAASVPAAAEPWVQRTDSGLRVEALAAPRRALVEQLAAATGTQVFGSTAALDAAPAVSLRWQGRDALPLWTALLEGRVNFAAQCEARGCKLWLLGTTAGPHAAAQPALNMPPPRSASLLQPDPPGLFPAD